MSALDQMTLDQLKTLEIIRYNRYVDQYDHAGMDDTLRADLDEVRNEIQKRIRAGSFVSQMTAERAARAITAESIATTSAPHDSARRRKSLLLALLHRRNRG